MKSLNKLNKLINLQKYFQKMSNQMKLQEIKYNNGEKKLVKTLLIRLLPKNYLIKMILKIGKVYFKIKNAICLAYWRIGKEYE